MERVPEIAGSSKVLEWVGPNDGSFGSGCGKDEGLVL